MSAWYNACRTAVLRGEVQFLTDNVQMVLVGPGYTFNATHAHADISDVKAGPVTVSVDDVTDMKVLVFDVTFPAVADGDIVAACVAYIDDGAANLPVAYIDRRADTVPIKPTVGDGGSLTFVFDYLVRL
jgi:hypothetical protein